MRKGHLANCPAEIFKFQGTDQPVEVFDGPNNSVLNQRVLPSSLNFKLL